jgi:hypothetical protein
MLPPQLTLPLVKMAVYRSLCPPGFNAFGSLPPQETASPVLSEELCKFRAADHAWGSGWSARTVYRELPWCCYGFETQ